MRISSACKVLLLLLLLLLTAAAEAAPLELLDLAITFFLLCFEFGLYWFLLFSLLQLVQELSQARKRARHLVRYTNKIYGIASKPE
jgi:hypothetical protein